MKILFHAYQLCYRGTSVAMYDYAHFNETLLANESIITYDLNSAQNDSNAIETFKQRFKVIGYQNREEINQIIEAEQIDVFYALKNGVNDGLIAERAKNCVHTVFQHDDVHGDVYAYISEWLSNKMTQGVAPYVPHMIYLPDEKKNLRAELNIPKDAIVFGRYGGDNTFDIPFVKKVIKKMAKQNPSVYFLFMGTHPFAKDSFWRKWHNIIFLPKSVGRNDKVKFINTCDAFLHARKRGETFGLAIAEFSTKNKPIITYGKSKEKAHLEILKDKAIIYNNARELKNILLNFKPDPSKNWDAYSENYSPETVMKKFKEVFID